MQCEGLLYANTRKKKEKSYLLRLGILHVRRDTYVPTLEVTIPHNLSL